MRRREQEVGLIKNVLRETKLAHLETLTAEGQGIDIGGLEIPLHLP